MAQMNVAMALGFIKDCQQGIHPPMTVWETEQLLHRYLCSEGVEPPIPASKVGESKVLSGPKDSVRPGPLQDALQGAVYFPVNWGAIARDGWVSPIFRKSEAVARRQADRLASGSHGGLTVIQLYRKVGQGVF